MHEFIYCVRYITRSVWRRRPPSPCPRNPSQSIQIMILESFQCRREKRDGTQRTHVSEALGSNPRAMRALARSNMAEGYYICLSGKNSIRILHILGSSFSLPGSDYLKFPHHGRSMPKSSTYHGVCQLSASKGVISRIDNSSGTAASSSTTEDEFGSRIVFVSCREGNATSHFCGTPHPLVHVRTPCTTVFCSTHHNRFQISLLRCHFSVSLFEAEWNLHGSRPTLGVRKSGSLPCDTCSGLSFTPQILRPSFHFFTRFQHLLCFQY